MAFTNSILPGWRGYGETCWNAAAGGGGFHPGITPRPGPGFILQVLRVQHHQAHAFKRYRRTSFAGERCWQSALTVQVTAATVLSGAVNFTVRGSQNFPGGASGVSTDAGWKSVHAAGLENGGVPAASRRLNTGGLSGRGAGSHGRSCGGCGRRSASRLT